LGNKKARHLNPEFLIRYRFPRSISRSYETVLLSETEVEIENRIKWCANATVRFLSALYQANLIIENPSFSVNPPSINDFKSETHALFPRNMVKNIPVELKQMAGVMRGGSNLNNSELLAKVLEEFLFLAEIRIVIIVPEGFRILLGPRMEYFVWHNNSHMENSCFNKPVLFDPETGRGISLSPLVIWERKSNEPFGHLYILRKIEDDYGFYIEDGIPGTPTFRNEIDDRPAIVNIQISEDICEKIYSPDLRFRDGEIINECVVQGVIWHGGISDIYIAQINNDEALKVIKTFENKGNGFDINYKRFMNEGRFAGRICHPGINQLELVHSKNGGTFYFQEFHDGGSLRDIIDDNGVLTLQNAKRIMTQLCDILSVVHSKGIVHNDIKPDNILLKDGSVKLIDFGIAFDMLNIKDFRREGVPPGTVGYVAPEIKEGVAPSIQSDIYSLGIVFAEMLTGKIPDSILNLNYISPEFFGFFKRTLASKVEERFQSVELLNEALRQLPDKNEHCLTLDIEGTLVTNYYEKFPRPELREFLEFCIERYDRIFVYTLLNEEQSFEVFDFLCGKKYVPDLFMEKYEYITWSCGMDGTIKDLKRCGVPLEMNLIVDDTESMIPEDQRHRWVQIVDFNEPKNYDRELSIVQSILQNLI
jgi:tRNA A-37 threonylcarbamoyl transferase component Bud32